MPFLAIVGLWTALASTPYQSEKSREIQDRDSRVESAWIEFNKFLNPEKGSFENTPDGLRIEAAAKTDFFNDVDETTIIGNAPAALTAIDNTRSFTFTVRVQPTLAATYDAGAVLIWLDARNWLKVAMERDERGVTRIVTVRTVGTSDDNNHEPVRSPSVFVKISSDTKSIGVYFSEDGKRWQLARVFRNDYPAEISIGLSSQSPTGAGNRTTFTDTKLTDQSVRDFRSGE